VVVTPPSTDAVPRPAADDRAVGRPRGFRPTSRRRTRIAGGAALAAAAIGGNVLLYASLDDRSEVLQVVRDVRAGELITSDDVRIVDVDLDPTVPSVRADQIGLVVNRYARVHLASGTLVSEVLVQSEPLVSPGASVVAIEVRETRIPTGLRERSQVQLVVDRDGTDPLVTSGRIVSNRVATDSVSGVTTLSVEVAQADATAVAASDDVRIVLVDPGRDPAFATEDG
jgi:hypothetical protein